MISSQTHLVFFVILLVVKGLTGIREAICFDKEGDATESRFVTEMTNGLIVTLSGELLN